MTDNNHPITPPPELVREWIAEWSLGDRWAQVCQNVALVAARWGADQELEACCGWLDTATYGDSLGSYTTKEVAVDLRAARRPKPPSLKEQALETLKYPKDLWSQIEVDTIRRALESLPD